MELTKECKEDFEEWYWEQVQKDRKDYVKYGKVVVLGKFYRAVPSMKFGVYVDFFDTLGIKIRILTTRDNFYFQIGSKEGNVTTRPAARKEAVEEASDIYNKR